MMVESLRFQRYQSLCPDRYPRSSCHTTTYGQSAHARSISTERRACVSVPQLKQIAFRQGVSSRRRGVHHAVQQGAAEASDTICVLVPLADGSEEIEAVTIIDTLRRAGAQVMVASVEDSLTVTCSRGVRLEADGRIDDYKEQLFAAIALPGGMPGAERLRDCSTLQTLLVAQAASDRLITAICAAPAVVLKPGGFLDGRQATCHPAFAQQLADKSQVDSRVVVDGNVITSRGPGTALEFALTLVKTLYGASKAEEVAGPMVLHEGYRI